MLRCPQKISPYISTYAASKFFVRALPGLEFEINQRFPEIGLNAFSKGFL